MQQEVAQCLSPFEQNLARSMRRIEIRGKRGRCVPVLLTEKHFNQLEALCSRRSECGIHDENQFVFARDGHSQTPIRSSDVLKKFASDCGAKNPELITSTSLRKHVATISQILSLKDNELDSLANFLGHDINIHRQYYRLPEDTIQLAKISKLLLEIENGNISNHKGKTLDEILLDSEETLEEEDEENELDTSGGRVASPSLEPTPTVEPSTNLTLSKQKEPVKKPVKRKMWTDQDKAAIDRRLGKYLLLEKLPGKHEIEEARHKEPVLLNRDWVQIKSFIKNVKVSKRRKQDK